MTVAKGTLVAACVAMALAGPARAQAWGQVLPGKGVQQGARGPLGPPQAPPKGQVGTDPIAPNEVQAMFDTMLIMDAEKFMVLTPEQFPMFVQRVRKLQDVRIQQIRKHNRAFGELRAMSGPQNPRPDEAAIDAKLKELDAIEVEAANGRAKAMEALDQMLSPLQRARFRLLEDGIEKKKIDFINKVRQPGRGGDEGID